MVDLDIIERIEKPTDWKRSCHRRKTKWKVTYLH